MAASSEDVERWENKKKRLFLRSELVSLVSSRQAVAKGGEDSTVPFLVALIQGGRNEKGGEE